MRMNYCGLSKIHVRYLGPIRSVLISTPILTFFTSNILYLFKTD
jgi:hypothetical protein